MDSGIRSSLPIRIRPLLRRWWLTALLGLLLGLPLVGTVEASEKSPLAPPELLVRRAFLLDRPPTLDGRLDDWPTLPESAQAHLRRKEQLHPNLGEAWQGPTDASAHVSIAVHGEDLYLAVRFVDDVVFHDPDRSWWHGDSLEVFLDADRPADGPPPHTYTDGCRQLFVMPANPDLPWGVVYRGRALGFDDGGLRGLEVARGPVTNEGQIAEVRIPLRNLGIEVLYDFLGAQEDCSYAYRRLSELPPFAVQHNLRMQVTPILLEGSVPITWGIGCAGRQRCQPHNLATKAPGTIQRHRELDTE